MDNRIHVIYSFKDFIDALDFTNKPRKEQIAYVLYYVTRVSKLREDMIPAIISNRLDDQIRTENKKYLDGKQIKLKETTPKEIEEIMENTPEYFVKTNLKDIRDRPTPAQPYILSEEKTKALDKEFQNNLEAKYNLKRIHDNWFFMIAGFVLLISFIIAGWMLAGNMRKQGVSWQEYKIRANFDKIDNYQKSVYILHYVTNVIEFIEDMTPEVLSNRLVSLKYGRTPADSINSFLKDNEWVVTSPYRKGAYTISAKGKNEIGYTVGVRSSYDYEGNVDFVWIWKNKPELIWMGIASVLWIIVICMRFAYKAGWKANLLTKLDV